MARRNPLGGGPGQEPENREPEEEQPPQPVRRPRPEPEPEPEPVARRTVELGGRKFELDPGLADALDAYRAEAEDRNSKQQRAIEELYGRIPRAPESAAPAVPNYDTLLFEKPSEALRLYGEQIKADLQRQYQEDQTTQQQQRVMEKFWFDFYQDHPELREDELLVRSVFGSNLNALIEMTPDKARSELAGMAKGELSRIATRHGQPAGEGAVRVEEGGRTRRGPGAERPAPAPTGPRTLTEALKMRREARMTPIRRQEAR